MTWDRALDLITVLVPALVALLVVWAGNRKSAAIARQGNENALRIAREAREDAQLTGRESWLRAERLAAYSELVDASNDLLLLGDRLAHDETPHVTVSEAITLFDAAAARSTLLASRTGPPTHRSAGYQILSHVPSRRQSRPDVPLR